MIIMYKQIGETPLQALQRLRRQRQQLQGERLSYAGRLDPMAAGVLPVLVGEENDRREEFLRHDKAYAFTVLFGVGTDTFDLLGVPTKTDKRIFAKTDDCGTKQRFSMQTKAADRDKHTTNLAVDRKNFRLTESSLESACADLVGTQDMMYPSYSARTVTFDGQKTPLWQIARAGRLDEVDIPTKSVEIYSLHVRNTKHLTKSYIIRYIIHQIRKVAGDFRQEKIIREWKKRLQSAPEVLSLATFRLQCSSGTYVRRLAERMGEKLHTHGTLFSLLRTDVGEGTDKNYTS